jgi:uncharacterized membrane protein YkoI
MKRNIVIAVVTAAALVGGGTATALATSGDDDPGTTRQSADVRGQDDDAKDDADDRADDDGTRDDEGADDDEDRNGDDRNDDDRAVSAKVTAADAVAAALREAPGTAVSVELDDEDGDDDGDDRERAAWEVDVLAGDGTWHSVRIDPANGKVLGSGKDDDTDEVRAALKGTSVDAAEAAKAAAAHGTVTSVELDDDGHYGDGKAAWEAETRSSGKGERDWRVDPASGKVTADRSGSSHSDSDSDSDDD